MKISTVAFLFIGIVVLISVIFVSAIVFSKPETPSGIDSLDAPFKEMNFKTLPSLSRYSARDGMRLAYRSYPAIHAKQSIVLIHGSSADSHSMHALAEYLQKNDMNVYVPDVRGHGESGRLGDIDYVGQLEDDLEDFVSQQLKDDKSVTLAGFSSGGGFVLRFAGSDRQKLFKRYVVLAPFIRHDAPTTRPNNGQHANPAVPRILALTLLGPAGQKLLGHLPVVAFGVRPDSAKYRTSTYSYRLWSNFATHYRYDKDLKAIRQPLTLLVGDQDELFYPQKYLSVLAKDQPHAEIRIVEGVGHTTLTTHPLGLAAIAETLQL